MVRLTGKSVRERLKYGRWASERVEMSADRVDRTRAVTTLLTKRDPIKGKSVRERLRKIWQMGFREGRNVGGPIRWTRAVITRLANCDPTNRKSVCERLRKIQVERYEGGQKCRRTDLIAQGWTRPV